MQHSPLIQSWQLSTLLLDEKSSERSQIASNRLLEVAAGLEPGAWLTWSLTGNGSGRVSAQLDVYSSVTDLDGLLRWVVQGVALWGPPGPSLLGAHDAASGDRPGGSMPQTLHELIPAIHAPIPQGSLPEWPIAENHQVPELPNPRMDLWPLPYVDNGMELLRAIRSVRGQIRVHLAPASPVERQMVAALTRSSIQSNDPVQYSVYMGTPLRVRFLVGQHDGPLSPRIRAAISRLGAGLQLIDLDVADPQSQAAWDGAPDSLVSAAQPFGVAQCFLRIPAAPRAVEPSGIPTAEAPAPPVPCGDEPWPTPGLRLGYAVDSAEDRVEVTVSPSDLVLHTQVLGATGMGKSTLLAAMAHEAITAGFGVTVIESHGQLIDRVLHELPEVPAEHTAIVRSGDLEHPVPLNVVGSDKTGLMAEVMMGVLKDLFDPRNEGIIGPRFERIFGLLIKAQQAMFGSRATMTALPLLLRDRNQVRALARAVQAQDPETADALIAELAGTSAEHFSDLSGWVNSKFHRMAATPEVRAILGTGADAIDVTKIVDDQGLLLIDLSAATVGPLAAQMLGEMWLAKHWAALGARADRSKPHLLIVDEAHLFGSGLLPRLLAEARKFGLAVVLAHQHLGQLTPHLREAAIATTSNVVVFRSGPNEAVTALTRLGNWTGRTLTRLPRFNAAATLAQGGQQTDPFTLIVDYNERATPGSARVIEAVNNHTITKFVDPYRSLSPINADTVRLRLTTPPATSESKSSFLDDFLAHHKTQAQDPSDTR